ncbi:hypothetical protein AB3S75_033792 [Citrus x aurantiifolia]
MERVLVKVNFFILMTTLLLSILIASSSNSNGQEQEINDKEIEMTSKKSKSMQGVSKLLPLLVGGIVADYAIKSPAVHSAINSTSCWISNNCTTNTTDEEDADDQSTPADEEEEEDNQQ